MGHPVYRYVYRYVYNTHTHTHTHTCVCVSVSELERGGNLFRDFKNKAHNLSAFEKRVVVSGRRKQQNSPRKSAHLACMLERRYVYRFLAGKCEAGQLLESRWRRCDGHIKLRLKEVQLDVAHWIVVSFCE